MLIGLRKQATVAVLQVLQAAFVATANPDNTMTGHWTDDGAYARTLTLRGRWSPGVTTYPMVTVQTELGLRRRSAGNLLKVSNIKAGQLHAPVYGEINEARIACTLYALSEDEREQLSDILDDTFDGEANANAVPFLQMLANRGVSFERFQPDQMRETRGQASDGDPAHAPIVYVNRMVMEARVQTTVSPTPLAVDKVTINQPTIAVPSFTLTVGGDDSP